MAAFAGNSLLCRYALRDAGMDPAAFTAVRLASGAVALALLARARRRAPAGRGSWASAMALFAYAAGFSLAYRSLSAGAGALLLFGAVQATMIGRGLFEGERLTPRAWLGAALALGGLAALLAPGFGSPALGSALLMLGAGAAWGAYSLRGRGAGDPVRATAGNFLRAAPLAVLWWLLTLPPHPAEPQGWAAAIASGALASGAGYAIWYAALPGLRAAEAATVQLSVPALAALGGAALLDEPVTARLAASGAAILGGIALALRGGRKAPRR